MSAQSSLLDAMASIDCATLSELERNELVLKLRSALRQVETPWQQMQSLVWENSAHAAALKIAHDVCLFKNWAESGVDEAHIDQLCQIVRQPCDVQLLDRVLRALAYKGTLNSPAPNKYSLNAFSKSLSEPTMAACLDYWFDFQLPALSALPSFVQATSYQLPSNPAKTAWNQATNDPTPFFGWLQQRPEKLAVFGQVMQRYSASQPPWVDIYPAEQLLEGLSSSHSESHPVVVDVGGSTGHDLMKFVTKYKLPSGSCYLQDRPEVVEKATVSDEIVRQGLDFFKEQPVKGARAYYLHNILHDWPDDQCRLILSNIKASMDNETSKILIHELVRLEDSSEDLASLGEFTVMAILGAPERSEKQWRDLVASVGLNVVRIYSNPLSTHSILEVEV